MRIILILMSFLVGCSTMSTIRSNPPGAKLVLNGKYMGHTPVQVELEDGFGSWARYQAEFYLDGFEPRKAHLQQDTDWATAFLVGGFVCWWCVYFNGQRHRPTYEFDLQPLPKPTNLEVPPTAEVEVEMPVEAITETETPESKPPSVKANPEPVAALFCTKDLAICCAGAYQPSTKTIKWLSDNPDCERINQDY